MGIITPARGVRNCPPKKKSHKLIDKGVEDRITNLHSSIITHILSRLPTDEAVRTCILSRDWKFHWHSINNVKISDIVWGEVDERHWRYGLDCIYRMILRNGLLNGKSAASLTDMMEGMSLSHHVTSFTLFLWDNKYDLVHLTKWISAVMGPDIHTFRFTYAHRGLVLPQSLLECTSLRNLELKLRCTLRFPSGVHCFPNLVKLSLHEVELLNEDVSTNTLVLNFKVLQTLELCLCKLLNVKFMEIHAPALTTFKFDNSNGVQVDHPFIKILGANIANFEITCGLHFVLTGSIVSCAILDIWIHLEMSPQLQLVCKLLAELSSVEYLMLKKNMIEAIGLRHRGRGLALPRYDRLERLDIESSGELEGLLELLHVTPFLKFLEIHVGSWRAIDFNAVEAVPSCIISSLEEVTFRNYLFTDHEFELEKFLLRNGKQLKKIMLELNSCMPRDEFVKQLKTFPRASLTSLQIVTQVTF